MCAYVFSVRDSRWLTKSRWLKTIDTIQGEGGKQHNNISKNNQGGEDSQK